jgi:vancomycin resistance protein YoaR
MTLGRRATIALTLLAAAAAGGVSTARAVLPRRGEVARGLRVGGEAVPDGEDGRQAAARRAAELLARRFALRSDGATVLEASLAELGATADVDAAAREADGVGREGDPFARLDEALEARAGRIDVPLALHVPVEALAARLERFKEEHATAARPPRLDVERHVATAHAAGRALDVYAAAERVERAFDAPPSGTPIVIELPYVGLAPRATTDAVLAIDTTAVVARYETRFGFTGGQAGRAQNVARAAAGMDGVVLVPGEVVSFNANVGPRSEENGFTFAPEIYKGELREGVGGGTCQVAGTLHAAAFFAGLEIVERASHSRPSGYIPIGLDATVVYPSVDLKLRNGYSFPIVVHARVSGGVLAFELLGRERPATVELSTETVGVSTYKRRVEEASWLASGSFRLKQKGIRGLSIRKTRRVHLRNGTDRVEVTTDVYPPTFEIYEIAPGDDPAAVLPPPPEDPKAAAEVYAG